MALFLPADCADFLRERIRCCRLPASLTIFLFGFDPAQPEEERLLSAPSRPRPQQGVARIPPPHRPKPQTPPITLDEIGQRIEAWAAALETFPKDIVMEELAAQTHLHRNHLAKYFLHIGKDFRFWKLEKKVECACRLLIEYPETLVGDIAVKAGFSNVSNFFRQFHRLTHCTPKRWREQNKPGGPD